MAELTELWVDWVNTPRIIWVGAPTTEVTVQDLIDTIRGRLEVDMGALDDPTLISEAGGKQFLGGTTYVGLTLELNNAVVAFEARTETFVDGYITTPDAYGSGTLSLIDEYATFVTSGITAGMIVFNHGDDSKGTILSVRSETELITTPLTGGTDNQYDLGDLYHIYNVVGCEISGGNLVSVDYDGYSISQILPTFGTHVKVTAASSATQTEDELVRHSSYGDVVTLDVYNKTGRAQSGTIFPVGTKKAPCNNVSDALTIASEKGFDTIFILGNAVFGSGHNVENKIVIGQSTNVSEITIQSAAEVRGAEFRDMYLHGILDGESCIHNCTVGDLDYLEGCISNCMLIGTITLGGSASTQLVKCTDGLPGVGVPTIDIGGSGRDLGVWGYHGGIKLINKTGPESVSVNMDTGRLILDSTITNGSILVKGVGLIEDNSGPDAYVDTNGLVGGPTIKDFVWDAYRADHTISGTFGGDFSDAGATVEEIDAYLSANHGYTSWEGSGDPNAIADAVWDELRSGHAVSGSFGESIRLDSAGLEQSAIGEIDAYLSSIHGYTSWEGSGDPYAVAAAVWDEYRSGHTTPGTFGGDFSDAGATVEEIDAYLSAIHGYGSWEGSGDPNAIADAIWDELRSGHTVSGSFGESIRLDAAGLETDAVVEIDAYLSSIHGFGNWEGAGNAGVIADAVWDEYRVGHTVPGTFGGDFSDAGATVEEIDAYLSAIHGSGNWEGSGDPYAVADAVWEEDLSAHQVTGSAGKIVSDGYAVSNTIYTDVTAIAVQITRVLGLEHENAFLDNTTYDSNGQLLALRLRIFDSKTNAEAAQDGGSETTGLIATYTVESEYESLGRMKFYRMVKQ